MWWCGGLVWARVGWAMVCCAAVRCGAVWCGVPKALLPEGNGRDVYPRVQVNGRAVCLSARCVLVCCCTAGTCAQSHLAGTVLPTPVHGHTRCGVVCCPPQQRAIPCTSNLSRNGTHRQSQHRTLRHKPHVVRGQTCRGPAVAEDCKGQHTPPPPCERCRAVSALCRVAWCRTAS